MFFSIVFIVISNEQILATEQWLSLWKGRLRAVPQEPMRSGGTVASLAIPVFFSPCVKY